MKVKNCSSLNQHVITFIVEGLRRAHRNIGKLKFKINLSASWVGTMVSAGQYQEEVEAN